MLNNVGFRLQLCHTPTKGVNVAVSPLFTFTPKRLFHTCFLIELIDVSNGPETLASNISQSQCQRLFGRIF